ncbi:glycosyltransferase family 4 protein [Bacteroides luti]|nr:glycosyltransferase family 4 protein [Bacteroides luti]
MIKQDSTIRKIAYCIPSLYISGGMERVLTIKANYFAEVLGYDITIILTDGGSKPPYYKLSPKIKVVQLDINFEELWHLPFAKKALKYLKKQHEYKRKLTRCLMELKPDITVSMLRREINFINQIQDGSIKIGEIHINKDNFRDLQGRENSRIKKLISDIWMKQLIRNLNKLKLFICLTNEDKAKWSELNNVIVMPNPLAFNADKLSNCSSKKVIAVGRYVPQKGFDLLIKAWSIVSRKHPDWELQIYGDGNNESYINLVKEYQIEKSCILNGPDSNIKERYIESSIFVLSSRFEGFGMVIVEAMTCGVPAVSFTCPCGPKDIIKDREDGLLVENGNIEELAEKIIYLIENEEIRKTMGKKASKSIERFRMDNLGDQWNNIFDKLIMNGN